MADRLEMGWPEFSALPVDERVEVAIDNIVDRSTPIGGVVADKNWGYTVVGIDDSFPIVRKDLRGEPNNGLAFIHFQESKSESPAGVRVSGISNAAYRCLVGVERSWLKDFVAGVSQRDWMTVNRITSGVRHRLYDERMVWSAMDEQAQLDTLRVLCGGNEDAAFSLLVVGGAVDAAKKLRPESWVKSGLPPQDYGWNGCR